jgi:hypothetical protein
MFGEPIWLIVTVVQGAQQIPMGWGSIQNQPQFFQQQQQPQQQQQQQPQQEQQQQYQQQQQQQFTFSDGDMDY